MHPEPVLSSKRSHLSKKPGHHKRRVAPTLSERSNQDPVQPKRNKHIFKKEKERWRKVPSLIEESMLSSLKKTNKMHILGSTPRGTESETEGKAQKSVFRQALGKMLKFAKV